jgi:hypothetical protein
LIYNYSSAPFFPFYGSEIHDLLHQNWTSLGDLTCATVELLARAFGLTTPIYRATRLPGAPTSLPGIVEAVGGEVLLVPKEAAVHDLSLHTPATVFHYEHPSYRQNFEGFEAGMSAADLLFNYGPDARMVLKRGICLDSSDYSTPRTSDKTFS